ncbi:U1 [Hyposoter didymator ichnovirus]|nr:U1 [Hyposoter didymator ichnovirus]
MHRKHGCNHRVELDVQSSTMPRINFMLVMVCDSTRNMLTLSGKKMECHTKVGLQKKNESTHIFIIFIHTFFIVFIVTQHTSLPIQGFGACLAERPIARHDSSPTAIHTQHVHRV